MRLSKYFSTSVYLVIAILALSGARIVSKNHEKPSLFISKQQSSLNFQQNFWQYFSLGQKRLASSLIWISTILESDIDHYKKRDSNSWMFLRFNTISFLEPKFYENYSFGGTYLSIVKDDLAGASIIYDKGLTIYPNDKVLLTDAGFHYYFELGNFKKAFPIYSKLIELKDASPITISTFARLKADKGEKSDAFEILKQRYEQTTDKDSILAKKLYEHMYSIKAEEDLNCLNSTVHQNCSTKDLDGVEYVLKAKKYQAVKKWVIFQIRQKKGPR